MFSESKLAALRFRRSSTWYGLASVATVAALAVVVALFTWWNDLYRPIVHPLEAIERGLSGGALEQVDERVATLLGVDEEAVRTVRDGLVDASLGTSRLGELYEIAAGRPTGTDSEAPA